MQVWGGKSWEIFFLSCDIFVTRTVWGREGLASGTRLYMKLQTFVYSLVPRPKEEEEEKGPGFSRSYMRLIILDLSMHPWLKPGPFSSLFRQGLGMYTCSSLNTVNRKCVSETRVGYRVGQEFHFWLFYKQCRGGL